MRYCCICARKKPTGTTSFKVPNDDKLAICKICQGVFCCAECRHAHEIKHHAIVVHKRVMMATENQKNGGNESGMDAKEVFETTYLFCPICEKRPLTLKPELHTEILLHIELYHLPLRCQKCFKTYQKISDLKEFTKCVNPTMLCCTPESLLSDQSCYTDEASKVTVTKAGKPCHIKSQNSPLKRRDCNESHITPISIINMRWKAKSKLTHEEFISDSVSSIKNISSINNSSDRRCTETASAAKCKVIRCSSTPVHLEMVLARPKEQTFNATGSGHMSSIRYHSGCESDNSPAFSQPNSQAMEPVNRYIKIAGSRSRMPSVTPLRQVMSKSIQKAFAEHGLPDSTKVRDAKACQCEKMFDSNSSSEANEEQSPQPPPLDLRLSPAVRRSQSAGEEFSKNRFFYNQKKECKELQNLRREIVLSAQKLTTESIVITRTEHLSSVSSSTSAASSNYGTNSQSTNSFQTAGSYNTCSSVFKSCSSVEIITATTEGIQQLQPFNGENEKNTVVSPLTPTTRIPGASINKKIIKFDSPKRESFDPCEFQNSPNDVFFTPNATPLPNDSESHSPKTEQRKLLVKQNLSGRFSPLQRPSMKECAHSTAFSCIENVTNDMHDFDNDHEVFLPQETNKSPSKLSNVKQENPTDQRQGLWSFMTSVMRLPSSKLSNSNKSCKNEPYSLLRSNSSSLIKRCASIAGSLVRSKSLETESNSLKRKRTYIADNDLATSTFLSELNNSEAKSPTSDFNTSSKRFRIQGRRPIDRMRLNN